MKSILKFIMTGIGLALISIGVGGVVFSEQALGLLRDAVEQRAEEALGAEVTIGNIRFSREHGGVLLEDFSISNPPEFKDGDALTCEKILLQPKWNTLFAATPVFSNITLQKVDIGLRHEAGDGTNIGVLIRNIRAYLEKSEGAERDTLPREVKVEHVAFNSGTLKVSSGIFPIPGIPLDINAFEVNNVNEGKPVPVGKLMGVMLRDILLEAVTLKGVLKPMAGVLQGEMEQL